MIFFQSETARKDNCTRFYMCGSSPKNWLRPQNIVNNYIMKFRAMDIHVYVDGRLNCILNMHIIYITRLIYILIQAYYPIHPFVY